MNEKIAVFADKDGMPSDFYSAEKIDIYRIDTKKWNCSEEITLTPFHAKSAVQVRKESLRRLELIKDCNIIASSELAGIPFTVFDMAGKSIFTINVVTDKLLTDMIAEVEKLENDTTSKTFVPVELGERGYYFMDLISLQKENPDISSKKALKDFFENTPFMELTLICNHVPPWIENSGLYDIQCIPNNEHTTVLIKKHLCNE